MQAESCDRRKVVKDFCFPEGVTATPVKTKAELKRILTYQSDSKKSFFGFTLNSNEELSGTDNSFVQGTSSNRVSTTGVASGMNTHPMTTMNSVFSTREYGLNCLCVQF